MSIAFLAASTCVGMLSFVIGINLAPEVVPEVFAK
jgi:hypothetical protein